MNNIARYSEQTFEGIKHIDEYGQEYWLARELQKVLEYKEWRNFEHSIFKAVDACKNSGFEVESNFVDVTTFTKMSNGRMRKIGNYALSRYACYLIVMNGDPEKDIIAAAQTYFAVKTRQQELAEAQEEMSEDQKRLAIRNEVVAHNKSLADAAYDAGVTEPRDFRIFQNKGYQGLYGGLGVTQIHERKGLKENQKILDHMGSTELAANLFRATQTEEKLRRENVQGKAAANAVHYEVGAKVRQTIAELGGTMPEDLPTPEKSIKQIAKEQEHKKLK